MAALLRWITFIYFFDFTINEVIYLNDRRSFFMEFENTYLSATNKKVFEVDSQIECSHRCLADVDNCKATNFMKIVNGDGKHTCDLLRTSSKQSPTLMTTHGNWAYSERVSASSVSCVYSLFRVAHLACSWLNLLNYNYTMRFIGYDFIQTR